MKERIPATKDGSPINIRFRSKTEVEKIKRAARLEGLSFNTFVVGRAALAAESVIQSSRADSQPVQAEV